MSVPQIHKISAVSISPDALGGDSVIVTGIRNSRVTPNLNYVREVTTGQAWAHFGALYSATPMGSFSTLDIARAGAAIQMQGLNLTAASEDGTTFYGVKTEDGAVRVAGSNHVGFNLTKGIMVIRSITADHQGDAQMDIETHVTYDGTNEPFTEIDDSPLPTIPDDTHRYTLGQVALGTESGNMITLNGKTRVEIDFGVRVVVDGSDSDKYPTHCYIDFVEPTIRITTLDVLKFASIIPMTGKLVDSSHTAIFFRKRSKSTTSGFVASGTAEHVKFVPYDGLAYHTSIIEGSSNGHATAVIEIPLIGTGADFPIAVTWQSAIS